MAAAEPVPQFQVPPKLVPMFEWPRGAYRYRASHGGRGSGKSYSFALMAAVFGWAEPLRILCTRELQVSIRESMYAEIRTAINDHPALAAHYEIGESYIRGANGTEFVFRGLRYNISSIKSMAQIDLCIIEEAEDVPEHSWLELLPTVRAEDSELWIIWNPRTDGSPVDERFIKNPPDNAAITRLNADDNPWLPKVLADQRRQDRQRMDPNTYAHVWEGAYLENSEAQVLADKWRVDTAEPPEDAHGPYLGVDWGFAQDPTVIVRLWISADESTLYLDQEASGTGVEIDRTPALFDKIDQARNNVIRADSARPETISYIKRQGFRIEAAKKWSGSVEDGVEFLRSFDCIVIHERCKLAIQEARLYSYEVDRLTGDVKPKIRDEYNHVWDAARYALEPMIRRRGKPLIGRA